MNKVKYKATKVTTIQLLEVSKIPEYNPNKCFQNRGGRFS